MTGDEQIRRERQKDRKLWHISSLRMMDGAANKVSVLSGGSVHLVIEATFE
jgi:hypothetical protein